MLEARKSIWFEKIFDIYNRNLLKRRFNSLRIAHLETLSTNEQQLPLLIYLNHSSWWDGLVAFHISQRANLDSFIMMEEKQLRKLQIFRRLGAFSVVRDNAREAFKSIKYAGELLINKPNRALWIFPQGEILPNDLRPLGFYSGLVKIIEKAQICRVVPMAIRYEFLGNYKPDIFVLTGKIEALNVKEKTLIKNSKLIFENNLTSLLDELKLKILQQENSNFEEIL